jgi:polyisoprenoid-binding protein YceI
MLKKIVLVGVGVATMIIIFIFSFDWGTVKSNIQKTDYKLEGDNVFKEKVIYDLHLFDTIMYKASVINKDNLELLFNIDGLKKTTGRFNDVDVILEVKEKRETSQLLVTIKTISVFTNNKMRDESLVSDEFFNVQKYPEIIFKSDSLIFKNNKMTAFGNLNFMGETKSLNFPFTVLGKTIKNKQVTYGVSGEFDFDRTKYGMLHEKGVGDIVHISFYVDFVE